MQYTEVNKCYNTFIIKLVLRQFKQIIKPNQKQIKNINVIFLFQWKLLRFISFNEKLNSISAMFSFLKTRNLRLYTGMLRHTFKNWIYIMCVCVRVWPFAPIVRSKRWVRDSSKILNTDRRTHNIAQLRIHRMKFGTNWIV